MRARVSALGLLGIAARWQGVEIHVDQGGGQEFHRGKALVVIARRQQLVQQRLRHRLAGLVMAGETLQHRGLFQPMFVELRRQFDEIARHIGAGQARIAHLAEQAVQGMAEFMEQGHGIVEGQQAGIGFC